MCLRRVTEFYQQHRTEIDGYRPIHTFDFRTGQDTQRRYTKAKIVDMVAWIEGRRIKSICPIAKPGLPKGL